MKDLSLHFMDGVGWQAGAVTALVVTVTLLMVRRGRLSAFAVVLRLGVAAIAVFAALAVFDFVADFHADQERRALQARITEIASRALVPGSPLACLEGTAGEAVENACEKSVFAKPETAAAAVAYTEARLALLADAIEIGGGDAFAKTIAGLRRSIELDRFGLAAHVLATRDGCTAETCVAFTLLADSGALKANLKARAYDTYVARYAADWTKEERAPAAAETSKAEPAEPPAQTAAVPPGKRYDFPSAASIPPVSIMNSEPPRPPEPGAQPQAAEPTDAPRLPPRRPQTQGAATR
jgi:hypothetical protein